jgi:predicted O-methyltransferase YrrM
MEHFYKNIQGWFIYQPIYSAAVQLYPEGSHFVEVGSWRGRSTAFLAVEIANSGKNIKFDCIDTWRGSDEEVHQQDPSVVNDTLYDEFLTNMEPVKHLVNPIRSTSLEAVEQYADASLDFVLIDGSHYYKDVHADITAWIKKIKPGGMIAGDDYEWCAAGDRGVKGAVNELLPNAEIYPDIGCWSFVLP